MSIPAILKHKFTFLCMLLLTVFTLSGSAICLEITADSLSMNDIQNACDQVKNAGGGTVNLPAGTTTWSSQILKIPNGINIIGQGEDKTIITNGDFYVDTKYYGNLNAGFRISGFKLAGSSRMRIFHCNNFRVDHVTIEATSGAALSVTEAEPCVIDNSTIRVTGPYYGIVVTGSYDTYENVWILDTKSLLGSSQAVFIEDCTFYGGQHSIVGHGNAHYVARYNTTYGYNGHTFDAHGPGYGPPCGTRLVEAYNNTLNYQPEGNWKAFGIRGGSAVIFNNTMNGFDNGIMMTLETNAQNYNVNMRVHDVWIWNNTFNDLGKGNEGYCPGDYLNDHPHCNEVFVWNVNSTPGLDSQNEIVENKQFFLRAPNQEQDGFTYVTYTYPHPFRQSIPSNAGGGTDGSGGITPGAGTGGDSTGTTGGTGTNPPAPCTISSGWQAPCFINSASDMKWTGNLIDGDNDTIWQEWSTGKHWVVMDLGDNYNIQKIRLWHKKWGGAEQNIAAIFISDNLANWGESLGSLQINSSAETGWLESDITDKNGRYVKFDTESNATSPYWREINVYIDTNSGIVSPSHPTDLSISQ